MRHFFRIATVFLALFTIACSEKKLVVDKPDFIEFSIKNLLDEDVTISGDLKGNPFSLNLAPGETYSYSQDAMSGFVEKDKIPVYLANHIRFEGQTVGICEYDSSIDFKKDWKEVSNHHLMFNVNIALF